MDFFTIVRRMSEQKPWVIVDTGTLLSLLLGGEFYQPGYAHAKLLLDCAKKGLIHLVVPDMVAAEFCGAVIPLYASDFQPTTSLFGADTPRFKETNIPYGFSYGAERVALLNELVATEHATIVRTPCGDEYLGRLTKLMRYNPDYKRAKDAVWPPSMEELRIRLMSPHSQLRKAVKDNSLFGEHGIVSSGKHDRGELAVADAIKEIQHTHGKEEKIFVLFEGQDVRGRIIQRLSSAKGSEPYHQWHTKEAEPCFNPSSSTPEQFDQKNAATLGNINFLSTKGFLAGFANAAKKLCTADRVRGAEEWYILHPKETEYHPEAASGKRYLDEGYAEIIKNVNEKGLGRAYDKYRDRHITEMLRENEDEHTQISGKPQNAPWMKQIGQWLEEPESKETQALREVIKDYVTYRDKSIVNDLDRRFDEIMQNVTKLPLPYATKAINSLSQKLEQLKEGLSR